MNTGTEEYGLMTNRELERNESRSTMTATEQILNELRKGRKISGITALNEFRCYRLSSVIHNLRNQGNDISTEMIHTDDGKEYAEYYIKPPERLF